MRSCNRMALMNPTLESLFCHPNCWTPFGTPSKITPRLIRPVCTTAETHILSIGVHRQAPTTILFTVCLRKTSNEFPRVVSVRVHNTILVATQTFATSQSVNVFKQIAPSSRRSIPPMFLLRYCNTSLSPAPYPYRAETTIVIKPCHCV